MKEFKLKYPGRELGKLQTLGKILENRYAHMFDIEDTCDDTSLASSISEDSITSAPEGNDRCYNAYNQYQSNHEDNSTIQNRCFSTLGYWTPEPEHVTNSPITGKPYPEDEIKEELKELENSEIRHTQLIQNVLELKYKSYTVIDSGADQTTLGRGHVILDQEEFPGTSM